ncbi:aspartyl/asparaginyl beta-hydroxylase domain-containing protein [Nocardia sp. NBC_01377]|uniref:aspartyl/asparaginyl beta-hydroxylase domain-containing protein n=1 Tax=Nocardia sp. NBC_01377 TaxID=2903595 RepID=UPI00324DB377
MTALQAIGQRIVVRLVIGLMNWMRRSSRVGEGTFFDPDNFPWVEHVEAQGSLIRAELDELLVDRDHLPNFQDISVEQTVLTRDDKWKTYIFYAYGERSDANLGRCPDTARVLAEIPGLKTAFFSILSPGKHIPAHTGPWSGVLRYHLGLRIPGPEGGCRIRVGDDIRPWVEGGSLIFDDTYNHEAWNDTDDIRVVLFVDFIRPLRFPANVVNLIILRAIQVSPFITNSKQRQLEWEKDFERLLAGRRSDGK